MELDVGSQESADRAVQNDFAIVDNTDKWIGEANLIVHGHDNEGRDPLELALRRPGLEPFVLMNPGGRGTDNH